MKLIIQIPCFNEEETLPIVMEEIPRKIEGIDEIKILIIDDGSEDKTADVAKSLGVDYIVGFRTHQGLGRTFASGVDACLKLGADIIVNTDADNQYRGECISNLIDPILQNKADMVVGNRQIDKVKDFSWYKKFLQKLGSWVVRKISHTDVSDVTCGFRAFTKETALKMNVISNFSYTIETIIQLGCENVRIATVPISVNNKIRESRLFSNVWKYIWKSTCIIFKISMIYRPLNLFFIVGSFIFLIGLLLVIWFVYFYFIKSIEYIKVFICSLILLLVSFQIFISGLLADLISINRKFIGYLLYTSKKTDLKEAKDIWHRKS